MARVEREDSWRVEGDPEEILRKVSRYMKRLGMKFEEAEEDGMLVLEATQGSQFKTRLLGGWWVSAETLPKKAVVELEETSRGRRVRAVIEETMGFGWLDPVLADKYGSYFDSWLDGLEDVLEPYLACGKPPQARHRGKDERTRRYDRE